MTSLTAGRKMSRPQAAFSRFDPPVGTAALSAEPTKSRHGRLPATLSLVGSISAKDRPGTG
jgi:hypothetical protein